MPPKKTNISSSINVKRDKEGDIVAKKRTTKTVKKIIEPGDSVAEVLGEPDKGLTMEEALHLLTMKSKGKRRETRKARLKSKPHLIKKALRDTGFYLKEEGEPSTKEASRPGGETPLDAIEEELAKSLAEAKKKMMAGEEVKEGVIKDITLDEVKQTIKYPGTMLIIGKKFSGKTNLIRNLVDTSKFDVIILFTVSRHTENLNMLAKGVCEGNPTELNEDPTKLPSSGEGDDICIFESINDEIIGILLEFQKENPQSKMLLLFDDFIDGSDTLKKAPKTIQLFTSGRNFGISIIVSSQVITPVLPTTLRKNAEYLFVGKNTLKSSKQIGDEFGTVDLPQRELDKQIQNIKDHSWLFYDERNSDWYRLDESEIRVFV